MGFCEVVTRDPFTLVGRAPKPNLRFSDLRSIRLGLVSEVPTPWLCLQEDLRRTDLDPDALTRISDQTMAQNTADLRDGKLDVIQVFEPYVEILVAEGAGQIWHATAARGPTSYTGFLTTRKVLQNELETLLRVTRAMYRTQQWLHAHDDWESACAPLPITSPTSASPLWRRPSRATRRRASGGAIHCCRTSVLRDSRSGSSPADSSLATCRSRVASTTRSPSASSPRLRRRSRFTGLPSNRSRMKPVATSRVIIAAARPNPI